MCMRRLRLQCNLIVSSLSSELVLSALYHRLNLKQLFILFPYPLPTDFVIFPMKKLSPEEIAKKREHGKCWFCVEKWNKGHKCGQQLLMLDFVELEEEFKDVPSELQPELQTMKLNECAFYDTNLPQKSQTMKVEGLVGKHPVRILLDSGSTHSFIDSSLTKHIGWPLQPTQPFNVMIADEGKMRSQGCIKVAPLFLEVISVHMTYMLYLWETVT